MRAGSDANSRFGGRSPSGELLVAGFARREQILKDEKSKVSRKVSEKKPPPLPADRKNATAASAELDPADWSILPCRQEVPTLDNPRKTHMPWSCQRFHSLLPRHAKLM